MLPVLLVVPKPMPYEGRGRLRHINYVVDRYKWNYSSKNPPSLSSSPSLPFGRGFFDGCDLAWSSAEPPSDPFVCFLVVLFSSMETPFFHLPSRSASSASCVIQLLTEFHIAGRDFLGSIFSKSMGLSVLAPSWRYILSYLVFKGL